MEDIAVIAAGALTAGALSVARDETRSAVFTAYNHLKGLIKDKLDDTTTEELMERHDGAPEELQESLAVAIERHVDMSGAGLQRAVETLLEALRVADSDVGLDRVSISDSQGVQTGSGNVQVNRFG